MPELEMAIRAGAPVPEMHLFNTLQVLKEKNLDSGLVFKTIVNQPNNLTKEDVLSLIPTWELLLEEDLKVRG